MGKPPGSGSSLGGEKGQKREFGPGARGDRGGGTLPRWSGACPPLHLPFPHFPSIPSITGRPNELLRKPQALSRFALLLTQTTEEQPKVPAPQRPRAARNSVLMKQIRKPGRLAADGGFYPWLSSCAASGLIGGLSRLSV